MANSKNLVAWKAVFARLAMAPTTMTKELGNALTADLSDWLTAQSAESTVVPAFSEKECKEYATLIHKVFNDYKQDTIELSVLAAFYSVKNGGEIESIKAIVKGVSKMLPETFSIGSGASPRIRRLVSASGKATGQIAFDNTRKPREGTVVRVKGLLRNSKSTIEAFKNHGLELTDIMFTNWSTFCTKNGIDTPTQADIHAFAMAGRNGTSAVASVVATA